MRAGIAISHRYRLRPPRWADRGWLAELLVDEEVRKTTLTPVVPPVAGKLLSVAQLYDGRRGIEEVASGTPVGWITKGQLEPAPHLSLGFEIRREYWNRGCATAALTMLAGELFGTGIEALSGVVFVSNPASQRVFEKAGFTAVGPCKCSGHPCVLFEMTREQWVDHHLNA